MSIPENYSTMTVQERAKFLLSQGVEGKLDIDPEKMEPGFVAYVRGIGMLPCGYFNTEDEAISTGRTWLSEKAFGKKESNSEKSVGSQSYASDVLGGEHSCAPFVDHGADCPGREELRIPAVFPNAEDAKVYP